MNTETLSPLIRSMLADPDCPDEVLRDALLDEGIAVAKVYVLMGESGEYSDWMTWNVCAYLDRKQAEEHLARIEAWCKERGVWGRDANPSREAWKGILPCPHDLHLEERVESERGGPTYAVAAIDLKG